MAEVVRLEEHDLVAGVARREQARRVRLVRTVRVRVRFRVRVRVRVRVRG